MKIRVFKGDAGLLDHPVLAVRQVIMISVNDNFGQRDKDLFHTILRETYQSKHTQILRRYLLVKTINKYCMNLCH